MNTSTSIGTDSPAFVKATYDKVAGKLIPFLFVCYIVAFLDRVNVGFAKLQMANDLHFTDAIYGFGAGIFFIGYFIFEPAVLDYLNDDCGLEEDGLARLAADGQLNAYRHEGFWQPMDTFREYTILQELWDSGSAPWKMW